jgi:hypothetical protein
MVTMIDEVMHAFIGEGVGRRVSDRLRHLPYRCVLKVRLSNEGPARQGSHLDRNSPTISEALRRQYAGTRIPTVLDRGARA